MKVKNSMFCRVLWLSAAIVYWTMPVSAESKAKIWEETVVLPTYKVAPADRAPRFYSGRTYQGAKATFYPYPVSDQMLELREDQKYEAVYLENPYIKISVLPELGGRIFSAVDKGNNYDFFYRQHVIKPALIGMQGAWISGGVEWNIPHHHRASSFMPVDYIAEENADGSRTVWVGETELRHRMRWMVGVTLRPDHSYIEMTVKLFNRTPLAQSFLFWINPAVHVNPGYQVIFPPSTDWVAQHSKPEFASWPIARQRYGGTDYSRGVDISWWKNHPSPVSFFAWNCQEDFFGGYDHSREAGVAQISNHHVSPGKKFFEWGNGPEGEMWSQILSDTDGPYLELMAGSYSDNQPDYSWTQPCEVKVFKHYWYPIRKLGGIKNANIEAAVNMETSNHVARIAFNTTATYAKARVALTAGKRVLMSKLIRINPNEPFVSNVNVPEDVNEQELRASLVADGKELISYQATAKAESPLPNPVKSPQPPKSIASNEELYLTGLRVEQLYSPAFDPVAYYREAINRDAGDYRANTALGSLYCRQGRFEEAEPLLRTACNRAAQNYIRSKDGEAEYYLGVTLRAQGKREAAKDAFYKSIWSQSWQGAGYYALAELACANGNYSETLELVNRSLQSGALNTKALELRTSALRKLRRFAEAGQSAMELLDVDPLNCRALYEMSLTPAAPGGRSGLGRMIKVLRGEANSYLELSMDYANCGLYEEAIGVLEIFVNQVADKKRVYPLAYYYIGFFNDQLGKPDKALDAYTLGAQMPTDYCFPFQNEAESILRHVAGRNPRDARALCYLGNLLYDNQPVKAIAAWEKAVEIDGKFALAQRNLGLARAQVQKDIPSAILCLEKALSINSNDPRLCYELDALYESGGVALSKRLEMLNGHSEIVAQRDDAVTRRITLLIACGQPEEALRILRERHFHNWEGSSSLHGVFVDACIQGGLGHLKASQGAEALKDFLTAMEYPANQEVGRPKSEQNVARIYYCVGLADEALGQKVASQSAYEKAAQSSESEGSEAQYYQALALKKLGRGAEAETIFKGLEKYGVAELGREAEAVDYFAKFGEKRSEAGRLAQAHFVAGLGCLGLGKTGDAQMHFGKALELHPAHLGALVWKEPANPGAF